MRAGRQLREIAGRRRALERRYPEVSPFVDLMYAELAANSYKGDQAGWRSMTLRECWGEISWHAAKLALAVKAGDGRGIREYSADVANMAMMLVDIFTVKGSAQ